MDWKKYGFRAAAILLIAAVALVAARYALIALWAALSWLVGMALAIPANFLVLGLTIITLLMWRAIIPPSYGNLWSFVCSLMLSLTLAFGAHDLGVWLSDIFGATIASFIGWAAGVSLGSVLFWASLQDPPIEPVHGSEAMFWGWRLGLELRQGKYAWPFGIFRYPDGEAVSIARNPTGEVETNATTVNNVKMRSFLSLETRVVNVHDYLGAKGHDELLLNEADEMAKQAIEGDDCGSTAAATSNSRADIRKRIQEKLDVTAREIGLGVRVILRQMLPPDTITDAAAKREAAPALAETADIAAERLTARSRKFKAENGFTDTKDSMDRLLADDGKANLEIKRFEGFDALVKVMEDGITKAVDAFAPKQPKPKAKGGSS
jgi:hypothetical protein